MDTFKLVGWLCICEHINTSLISLFISPVYFLLIHAYPIFISALMGGEEIKEESECNQY